NTFGVPVALFAASTATCPNLPAGAGGPNDLFEVQASADDTKLTGYSNNRYVIYWNRTNNHCDWYDTATNTVGGSDVSWVQHTTGFTGLAAPRSIATPTLVTGGSFAAGTYCFSESLVPDNDFNTGNYGMETLPGPETCVTVAAGDTVTLAKPPLPTDANSSNYLNNIYTSLKGWNAYGCQEASPPTQCTPNVIQNASLISWAMASTVLSSLAASGATAPISDVAGFAIHQGRGSPSGNFVELTSGGPAGGNHQAVFGWLAGTTAVNVLHAFGHVAPGWNYVLYNDGAGSDGAGWNNFLMGITIATNPPVFSRTFNSSRAPGFVFGGDMHPSWADDYGGAAGTGDYMPACGSVDPRSKKTMNWSPAPLQGEAPPNGTTVRFPNAGYNPAWSTMAPKDAEILCEATDGSGTTWRFGHSRSSKYGWNSSSADSGFFYPNYVLGTITRDAKFMIFTSYWDWDLGSFGHYSWAPNTTYTSGTIINDSNGNLEIAQSNFTSGATIPGFSTTVGGLANDGATSGAWKMSQTGACPLDGECRFDVFVAELK
ncbi:MAG: hypothetical protein ACRD10_03110, partial [Terriglobia bacterium]